jgi:hypothetical protein
MSNPVFILAPPRSFTSVVSTMLGQHPQLYALPETDLFATDSLKEWWWKHSPSPGGFARSGLLRAIAELYFGEQSEDAVRRARGWILQRREWPTALVFTALLEGVHPLVLVEKSPTTALHPANLRRTLHHFPGARFIHLLRHPSTHRASARAVLKENRHRGPMPEEVRLSIETCTQWYVANYNITRFLAPLPEAQKFWIRGEDLLAAPAAHLRAVSRWLGIRDDDDAIGAMQHPEHSPFACIGPPSAPFGNNPSFLEHPYLRSRKVTAPARPAPEAGSDQLPLPQGVRHLAHAFGYD